MSTLATGQKQRWTIATVGAGSVVVALLFLFRMPPPPAAAFSEPALAAVVKPAVRLATRADEFLKAETDLRDLRPLFLPTERNASLPELKRELGRTFLDDEPVKSVLQESEVAITRDLPSVAIVGERPADQAKPLDALASESVTSLLGFGRHDQPVQPMAPRAGFMEVVSAATGERVQGDELPAAARVPGDKAWAPLEFLAQIDAVGLAVPLVVTTSSGNEEIDAHFKKYLGKTYRIGERLPPGFYRLIVAP